MKRAVVIGAGFGGLALAIRLQSAGIDTTIVEARDKPGGRAYVWEKDGFTFDAGPTVITDPDCLHELWALSGRDMAEDVDADAGHALLPAATGPTARNFDYSNDDAPLRAEIAKLEPGRCRGLSTASSTIRPASIERGLCQARPCRLPRLRVDDQGRAGAGQISGVALGLFDASRAT